MNNWAILNEWDDHFIGAYRDFVETEAGSIGSKRTFTCEDFALTLLTDFAARNQLPVVVRNGVWPAGESPASYHGMDDFRHAVLLFTGSDDVYGKMARDVVSGVKSGDVTSLDLAEVGNLIIFLHPNGHAHHIQVVTSVVKCERVTITQGDFVHETNPDGTRDVTGTRWDEGWRWAGSKLSQTTDFVIKGEVGAVNSALRTAGASASQVPVDNALDGRADSDPASSLYLGTGVRSASYVRDPDSGYWAYDQRNQEDVFMDERCHLMDWNFPSWNDPEGVKSHKAPAQRPGPQDLFMGAQTRFADSGLTGYSSARRSIS